MTIRKGWRIYVDGHIVGATTVEERARHLARIIKADAPDVRAEYLPAFFYDLPVLREVLGTSDMPNFLR